ncbi:membrane peptidoglycan carboxypeptidase [Trueperella bonasi]|uniref:Membrane peptidoglycan carboxypeptidase n=1 Tax=Trueperella bonasi TaxID=312286 RepID=A0ABT9NGF3_9ACTO|nr:penicillin-binding protein [Trueperella bonasi]MDP9806262.1 membrane peptidoglycan carboxypeptidase [Trueperella bonasi]
MQNSGRKMTLRQLIVALLSFFLLTAIGGGILAAAALPLAATTGTVANAGTRVFDDLPTEIDFTRPSQQSVILAADGSHLATFYAENRIIVPSEEISQYIKDAAVAIEDERFFQHNGIDAQGLIGAAWNNLTGGRLAGGSTITQQYVKNAIIEEGRILGDQEMIASATERSISRKLNEARYAIAVENQMSKDEILTGYLNLAQFGPSQWGVEAASRYFYGIPATDVTLEQAAMLAGITQAPGRWNPVTNPEEAKQRRDTVLGQMYKLDMITREEFEAAVAVPIEDMLNVTETPNGCAEAGISAYFCEYVVKDVLNWKELGETREERTQKLYRGGLVITTTIDPADQKAAYDAVVASTPVNDPSSINMSLSSVEAGTGHIKAMVQNTNYGNPTAENPDDMTLNLNVGMTMGGGSGYQSGSTFKVFTLMEWLNQGKGANDRVNANNQMFPRESWSIRCAPQLASDYQPTNIEGIGSGNMTVLDVTRFSVNAAYVNMANQLDMCDIVDMAADLGVERGRMAMEGDPETEEFAASGLDFEHGKPLPLLPNPSAALGSNPVTPLSMANAMATLGADGKFCEPMSFTKITDANGNEIASKEPECRQVIDAELARRTTAVLETVIAPRATGFRAELAQGRPVAGKTGTANMDWHAWFVGYTPQLGTAVWQGHHEGYISMFDSIINGRYHREVYGGLYPAQTFKLFMDAALADEPIEQFTPPNIDPRKVRGNDSSQQSEDEQSNDEPIEGSGPEQTVPNLVGKSQQDAQSEALAQGYGYITRAEASEEPEGTVIRQSPAGGEKSNRGSQIEIWISSGGG